MIEFVPFCTAIVDIGPNLAIGTGPAGDRSIGEIRAVTVEGERLRGTLAGSAAADWITRTGAIGVIDVRMAIRTDDGALIFVQYGGRLDLSNPASGIHAYIAPVFETGDERYTWLNRVQGAGKGRLVAGPDGARLEYEIYEIR